MATSKTKVKPPRQHPLLNIEKFLPWILVIAGVVGVFASYMITADKFASLQNPSYQAACDINPIVSCGSVMKSEQADVFGFMNTYIGLIGFPVILTLGVVLLTGVRLKRWLWLGLQIGLSFGVIFAYWLLFESVYRIKALCPFCLGVDVVITTAFWYVTLYNFHIGNLSMPKKLKRVGEFVKRHHLDLIIVWFVLVTALILKHFWYYYGQNF